MGCVWERRGVIGDQEFQGGTAQEGQRYLGRERIKAGLESKWGSWPAPVLHLLWRWNLLLKTSEDKDSPRWLVKCRVTVWQRRANNTPRWEAIRERTVEDNVDRPHYRHMLEHKRGREGKSAHIEKKKNYRQFSCTGVIIYIKHRKWNQRHVHNACHLPSSYK